MRTIPERESLMVEFKSDLRRLPDGELVATVVCLANTVGGEIYLGVEDDGRVTGLHPEHQNVSGLSALIANRTNPPLSVRVSALVEAGLTIARIEVPRSTRLVATSDGLMQRRRLQADGTPQCVPFYPHEFASRQSDLCTLDYAALPVTDAIEADFDPLERERLRQLIERYTGDRSLLGLNDDELDGALGLARNEQGRRVPTVAGLLILGCRIDMAEAAQAIQKNEFSTRAVLERLVEAGMIEAHGVKKSRTYTLSPRVYRDLGQSIDYVRQAGFDPIQQEQMVRHYVKKHGSITRKDVVELCLLGEHQASRLPRRLVDKGILVRVGERKGTISERGPNL
jgi:predicted HTH transcriptional regulator